MSILDTGERLRSIPTRKSMLPPPGATTTPEARRAYDWLFRRYAPAMVRYVRALVRVGGPLGPADAEDLVQSYLAECLEKGWLSRGAEPIRCFRAYLQTQLRRYVLAKIRDAGAQRRDPRARAGADALDGHPSAGGDPAEADLDRGFVEVATGLALDDLAGGNSEYHEIIRDLLRTDGAGSKDLGARLRRSSEQLVHLRHRARRRFAILLFDRLRETVRDAEDYEALCRRLAPYLP